MDRSPDHERWYTSSTPFCISKVSAITIIASCARQKIASARPANAAGSVVTACMEGTRPFLVEVQALVSSTKYGTGRRMTQGVDSNRVALMIAMLEKRSGMQLIGDDVFVNIAGGLEVDEPAADLGVVAAIASSFKNAPIDPMTAVFGEVGLTGEVRGTM